MSKQNFLHLKPHLVLGEAKVGSNWVNYQRASPGEHLLNRLPQAHITRRRMQLSFGGAKTGIPKMHSFEPCFHQRFQCSKLAWKNQCFRNISVRRGIKRTEGEWCWRWGSINVLNPLGKNILLFQAAALYMKMGVVLLGRRGSVRGRTEVAISYAHTQSDHGSQAGKDLLVFLWQWSTWKRAHLEWGVENL